MKEPTLEQLKSLGLTFIGKALDSNPSKKEDNIQIDLALAQYEIKNLKQELENIKTKK